jgi:hypothetical protein
MSDDSPEVRMSNELDPTKISDEALSLNISMFSALRDLLPYILENTTIDQFCRGVFNQMLANLDKGSLDEVAIIRYNLLSFAIDTKFSPDLMETKLQQELEILEKIYASRQVKQ